MIEQVKNNGAIVGIVLVITTLLYFTGGEAALKGFIGVELLLGAAAMQIAKLFILRDAEVDVTTARTVLNIMSVIYAIIGVLMFIFRG